MGNGRELLTKKELMSVLYEQLKKARENIDAEVKLAIIEAVNQIANHSYRKKKFDPYKASLVMSSGYEFKAEEHCNIYAFKTLGDHKIAVPELLYIDPIFKEFHSKLISYFIDLFPYKSINITSDFPAETDLPYIYYQTKLL
jgi:hypothetical protein